MVDLPYVVQSELRFVIEVVIGIIDLAVGAEPVCRIIAVGTFALHIIANRLPSLDSETVVIVTLVVPLR